MCRGETFPARKVAAETQAYEQAIRDSGGIDLQILGIGKTGHIGFNEPGSGVDSRTRRISLDTVTRRDAAGDFFGEDNVPTEAITMGVATIMEAREIALVATGEHKAAIIKRAVEGEPDPDVAATYLQQHPNAVFYVDFAAAADLTRIRTPWVMGEVKWTRELEVAAVIWLSEVTGKVDSQARQSGLPGASPELAPGALPVRRSAERRDFQRADFESSRAEQAAVAAEHRRLFAASRRRRHLDGRDAQQAAPEQERHRRRLSDVGQHRGVRPRGAPLRGFSAPREPGFRHAGTRECCR